MAVSESPIGNGAAPDGAPLDLIDAIRASVRATPDAIAVACQGVALTYAQLDARAERLAIRLQRAGVVAESLVGVFVERSVDMIVAVLGVQRAGGAYVPIDPAYPAERIAFLLDDCGAALVVTHERLRARVPAGERTIVSLDAPADADSGDAALVTLPPGPRRLAYAIYTSGSTGKPKGVLIEHHSVINLLAGVREFFAMGPGDTMLALAPLAFDMSVLDVFLPLCTGARLVVAPRDVATNPKALLSAMHDTGVTHMQATPSTWRMLVDAGWSGDAGLTIVTGGEALPPRLADQLVERAGTVWNLYGPTEATVWATGHRIHARGERATIGRAMANVRTYIVDDDARCVAAGETGELCIAGDGVARGYLHRPELTAERFVETSTAIPERFYKTGDRARYADDGAIEFLGRRDEQVKLRGHRIELGEVEHALARDARVSAAVAIVREDAAGDQRLIAYVTAATGDTLESATLRRALLAVLPAYMIPDAIVQLDALPVTSNGKVDRARLPAPDANANAAARAIVAPRTPLEARLVALWEDILGVRPIGVTDDFFDLGATSIAAARVFDRIERELGTRLPLSPLFAAPTVERLAALVERGDVERRWTSLVPVQPLGTQTPLFFVHGGAGTILHFHDLARRLGNDQPFYGLQMRGLYGDVAPKITVEAMATQYLAEIRTVQPAGPYRLGGYCFGAIVAFDMAQRLRAAGEDVELLVSVNGPSPAYIRRFGGPCPESEAAAEPVPPSALFGKFMFALKRAWWTASWHVRWELQHGMRDRAFDLRTRLVAAGGRPLPDRWRQLAIYRICNTAEKRYRARAYDGSLIVFAAAGLYRRGDLGWAPYVRGTLETHVVPGTHATQRDAMFEPKVAAIADVLTARLGTFGHL